MLPVLAVYLGLRIVDLAIRRQFGALFAFDVYGTMSLVELALFVLGATLLAGDARRRDPGNLMRAALVLVFAGALYRFDVFLLAFQPGPHWSYFPNVNEILITVGLVAGEIGIYIVFVRMFPILAGRATSVQATTLTAALPSALRGVS
jgi:Ni/Fe-hydrogenase subunit HybB-like protein